MIVFETQEGFDNAVMEVSLHNYDPYTIVIKASAQG